MQNNNKSEIIYSLSQLWGPLSEEHQNTLLDNIQIKSFKKNQLIYKDFDGPTRMMLLYQGKVKVSKMGIGGRSQIIRAIKPSVSELTLLQKITRPLPWHSKSLPLFSLIWMSLSN